jgi:hypothetical protein
MLPVICCAKVEEAHATTTAKIVIQIRELANFTKPPQSVANKPIRGCARSHPEKSQIVLDGFRVAGLSAPRE